MTSNAGILNYHRNFALACVEAGYKPALDVRINSVALADALRDTASAVLDVTRAEEHWSLAMLQGLVEEGASQKYNMITAANKSLASITEAQSRLTSVLDAQKTIMNDAAKKTLPGRGMEVFGAMSKTVMSGSSANFDTRVNDQLSTYVSKVNEVKTSLQKTVELVNSSYAGDGNILSKEHAELSDQIRVSTKATFDLVGFAEITSEETVKEVRDTAASLGVTSCGGAQK